MSDAAPGQPIALEDRITRILAPNPSAFTFHGTNSYLVGTERLAVIDPGPDLPAHLDALLAAIAGRPVEAILCTHTHRDHSPAAAPLKAATNAPIIGCAPLAPVGEGSGPDSSFDHAYAADRVLADGEALEGAGWRLTAIATPGHTSNHLCFALDADDEKGGALFSGDHVMGWSTTVTWAPISPAWRSCSAATTASIIPAMAIR
jgi:glyoxylase-like metal-dependent hydrolase (beta-lactamase superfamily II)